jgi:4-carboxymuconolactone decarboxylase
MSGTSTGQDASVERLPRLREEEMSAAQREIYDRFRTGPRAAPDSPFTLLHPDGGLIGPPNAWLLSPAVGNVLEQLGGTMRYGLGLPGRCREIAILLVAYHRASAFELYAHRPAGRAAGLTEDEIEGLATEPGPDLPDPAERAVHAATRAMLRTGTLSDAEYADAVDALGASGLFELVVLIGYYQLVATQLAVFGVVPPAREAGS